MVLGPAERRASCCSFAARREARRNTRPSDRENKKYTQKRCGKYNDKDGFMKFKNKKKG